ncbi:MAG: hypothetical protein JW863_09520 [Chitinispirillaceae bacterium]|nr:hypothetical protein [Chitinispirillaceae bacterium]
MNQQTKAAVEEISRRLNDDDFLYYCEEQCELLKKNDLTGDSIDPLIRLFENNPFVDFGVPGPIVHFIEKFGREKYESILVESIRRRPTAHTVWMLNRIINVSSQTDKITYLELFKAIVQREDIDNETKDSAIDFLKYHNYS